MFTGPRWTHIALPSADVEASIAWYENYTPLRVLKRMDDAAGRSVWLAHPGPAEHPFVLVLVDFTKDRGRRQPQLGPFAHLGMELASHDDVDRVAALTRESGCLVWEPQQIPPPVGYVCAATDPDGNVVEFSFDQGVYAEAEATWGTPTAHPAHIHRHDA